MAKQKANEEAAVEEAQEKSIVPTTEEIMKNKYMIQDQKKPYVYKDPVAKRYRKKLLINFMITLSVIALLIIVVIAYLGSIVGNLTIQLQKDQSYLTMCETYHFDDDSTTSRLRATAIKASYASDINKMPSDEILDADVGDKRYASHNGNDASESGSGVYLAYTWYVKNVGDDILGMNYNIKIVDLKRSMYSTYTIDEAMRVMLYENEVIYARDKNSPDEDKRTHNYTVYAKGTNNPIVIAGETEYRECVGESNGDGVCIGNNKERAERFYSDKYVMVQDVKQVAPFQVLRYTLVIWIEGNDPECVGNPPNGAGMEFSMEFNFIGTYKDGELVDSEGNKVDVKESKTTRDYFTNSDLKYL